MTCYRKVREQTTTHKNTHKKRKKLQFFKKTEQHINEKRDQTLQKHTFHLFIYARNKIFF